MAAFHSHVTAVKSIELAQRVRDTNRDMRPTSADELLHCVFERLLEICIVRTGCKFGCVLLSLDHKVYDFLLEPRATLCNCKCFQRLFGALT